MIRARPTGCGARLPDRIVTNAEMAGIVDTDDAWIVKRTGIRERRFAAEGETTADLAIAAARAALDDAGADPGSVDAIVLATSTPDDTFPATATRVQAALGAGGFAFDVQAVCSGFVYALSVADAMMRAGQARRALVIGAETFSRILDFSDRGTCVLFGDGAGALVLDALEGDEDRGVLSTHLFSDGRHRDKLYVDGGPSSTGTVGKLRMSGRDVFKHAVVNLADAIDVALQANGVSGDAVDWFVPHQANARIVDAMARRIGVPAEKTVVTIDRHANTSAASIPLALAEIRGDGRLKAGDLVLIEAMGGGFTWGSALVRW